MADQRYYEVLANDVNYPQMLAVCTSPLSSQVTSVNGLNIILKLQVGDNTPYPFFDPYPLLTYLQCLTLRRSAAYQRPIE